MANELHHRTATLGLRKPRIVRSTPDYD